MLNPNPTRLVARHRRPNMLPAWRYPKACHSRRAAGQALAPEQKPTMGTPNQLTQALPPSQQGITCLASQGRHESRRRSSKFY